MFELVEALAALFVGGIMMLAVTAFGVWCYAAYKWIRRRYDTYRTR